MDWIKAPDIQKKITQLVASLSLVYIEPRRVICFRSFGSKSRARARIWSLPRVWQKALGVKSHYVVEVISEKFTKLSGDDQCRVLIHELLHIPKNFSGSLLPHRRKGQKIYSFRVEKLFQDFKKK